MCSNKDLERFYLHYQTEAVPLGNLYEHVEYIVPERDGRKYALIKDHEIHSRRYC